MKISSSLLKFENLAEISDLIFLKISAVFDSFQYK